MNEPLYFEDLAVGSQWTSQPRIITPQDVATFAELTGDHDPLHANLDDADDDNRFGRPIAHGLLGLSLMAGLSSRAPLVKTQALVMVQDWQFRHPIYFGDAVHAVTEVRNLRPYGKRAGRVTWFRKLVNQDGRVVQRGEIITLVSVRTPQTDSNVAADNKIMKTG
ncbi:MAG: MaoC/PaaZ C-terminal domain-containing protein [Planctomycetota bacterium]